MMNGRVQVSSPTQLFTPNILSKLRANNWDIGRALRTNATLPRDAWIAIDKKVIEVAQQRLNGIADLQSRGLTRNLGGIGYMYDYWQTLSDDMVAQQSMSGITPGANNAPDYGEVTIPIPITHVDFQIPIRKLIASEQNGSPLDTTMVSQATRKVVDKLEDSLFNGSDIVVGGNSLPGYMNYSGANEVSCTGDWTGTPANIEVDVIKLIAAAEADHHYGPFVLYVPGKEWLDLLKRDSYADRTYLDIVKSLPQIADVKTTGVLGTGDVVLVEMMAEVVDLTVAVDIMVVEWDTYGGMQSNFKVMAVMAARIKSDYDGNCGICFDNNLGQS